MRESDTLILIDEYTGVVGSTMRHCRVHALQQHFVVSPRITR
jgi:hypothetical protein